LKLVEHIHIDLINACKKGNQQAQYELYKHYAKPMFNVAIRIIQKREEAEDVLQECFIDMFNKLDTWRGDSSFGSWFKRIVVNRSINAIKRKKMILVDESKADKVMQDDLEIDENEEIPYTVEQVKAAMNELPDGFRIVFSLYIFEDYTHKQIAEELNITESTSKSQLNRARNRMKVLLKNSEQQQ
jgi:RNA polymerase sigma factor (sigma-70 family)